MIEKAAPQSKQVTQQPIQSTGVPSAKRNNNRPIYISSGQGGGHQIDAPAAFGNYGTMAAITGHDGNAARVLSVLAEAKSCCDSTSNVISRLGTELRSFIASATQQGSRPTVASSVEPSGAPNADDTSK